MKTTYTLILLIQLLLHSCVIYSYHKAVINVPIADLLGQPITTIIPNTPAEQSYNSIAMCGTHTTSAISCPRLHQLLYNDIVDVVKEVDDEVCIQISHAYYVTPSSETPQHQYWTLKKNITYIDDVNRHTPSSSAIPESISFADNNHHALCDTDIVTLTEPHYDSTLKLTFSAGTRFVKTSATTKKRVSTIEVFAIDYTKMKQHTIRLPFAKCMTHNVIKTKENRINDFICLLKKWAHCKQGNIPYVWGGTSFTQPVHGTFKEITKIGHNGDYAFYEYEKMHNQSPKNGFDCSGLILRAAQICGIPYFCKNTTTIAQCLPPLKPEDRLQAGDLILIKGHVMIISDIAKNLLIEARSYGHGYGKLHEISINQVFDGIETYDDLRNAYIEKKVVKRKDKEGKIRDTFSNLQLFLGPSIQTST